MNLQPNLNQSWSSFLLDIAHTQDPIQRTIALLAMQTFAYHVWRERNARAHNNGIFSPNKLLNMIKGWTLNLDLLDPHGFLNTFVIGWMFMHG